MKILYISREYPPETGFGGIGTYTKCIAEGMAARGHEVHVISGNMINENQIQNVNDVTIHRIRSGHYPLPQNRFFYPVRKLCYRFIPHTLIRLAWATAVKNEYQRLLEEVRHFDIVEYPECGAEAFFLNTQSKQVARLHTPWHLIHSLDKLKEPLLDQWSMDYMERKTVKNANIVTSPSVALAKHIRNRWRIGTIEVIPNPIPTNQYPQADGTGWIYTGRIEMRKGIHILIEAYAALSSPPPLTLIGRAYGNIEDGTSYESYIKKLIQKYNLENKVTIIPGVPHEELKKYLQMSAVAFFPSLWENFPYSCLEAMASGLTVVTSDTGGYPDMVNNNECGLLVKANSHASLYQAMKYLLEKPQLVRELGLNARRRVQTLFDSSKVCELMEKIYEN
ncbi:MAG: glycosyltransferase family 4 protein [Fibrobacter sp.]|nr:glycosyltransferase family 4 protein [Fibrobacter sp.]